MSSVLIYFQNKHYKQNEEALNSEYTEILDYSRLES